MRTQEGPLKAIVGGTVLTPEQRVEDGVVVIDGAAIRAVGAAAEVLVPDDAERIDARGRFVVPGLIDVHVHGLLGHDIMGPGLSDAIPALPRHGVTSFMATSFVSPHEEILAGLRSMAGVMASPPAGASCLGIHIEGPFLSRKRPGMANPDWVRPLAWDAFAELQEAAAGRIRMVTFAPEEGEAMGLIPRLVESGVKAVMGHSDATYEQAAQAIALGVDQATHTFNAMRPFHHREPGIVGAVLHHREVFAQLVADGIHVHPVAMSLLLRAKGADRVVLISDASPLAGLPEGDYDWGHQRVSVRDGRCELPNGTIAGAHILLDGGVRYLVHELGLSPVDAVTTASRTPAEALGLERKGRLSAGCDADIVLMDAELQPVMTMVGGTVAWQAG